MTLACGPSLAGSDGGGNGTGGSEGTFDASGNGHSETAGGSVGSSSGGADDESSTGGPPTTCIDQLDLDPELVDPVVAVGASQLATCSMHASGVVRCWGGLPFAGSGEGNPVPTLVPGFSALTTFDGHLEASCGLDGAGAVWCVGFNHVGQLGVGANLGDTSDVPVLAVPVPRDGPPAIDIAIGHHHGCLLDAEGGVACWGEMYGPTTTLPDGETPRSTTPVHAMGIDDAVDVTAGVGHACAALEDGTVQCWGINHEGQLGDGTDDTNPVPAAVIGLDDVVQVSAGFSHTCALRADGTVECWGANAAGQLGDGTTTPRPAPQPVLELDDARGIVSGYQHTCAVRACGQVACWGTPTALGIPEAAATGIPVAVDGLDDAVSLGASGDHTCAVRADGRLVCWGINVYGQLGDGSFEDSLAPVAVDIP